MALRSAARRPAPRGPGGDLPLRLKPTLQLFPASDGALYLLRGGGEDEFVIRDAGPFERRLLELLSGPPVTPAALSGALEVEGFDGGAVGAALARLDELGVLERVIAPGTLAPGEAERYDRQLPYFADLLPGDRTAADAQRRLRDARVVILGCGGLGSWTASALACTGIGALVLVDDDTVALSNLNRQILFTVADLGAPKVDAAARRLRAFDPALEVTAVRRRMRGEADVAALLEGGADAVIATADWPMYELPRWVNRACVAAGVAYVTAGQFPPRVRVGPWYLPGRPGCLECLERAARRDYALYDELVAFREAHPAPAATLGPASGLVGSMLAMDALHHLAGLAPPAALGCALLVDLRTMTITREPIDADPGCPVCSSTYGDCTENWSA